MTEAVIALYKPKAGKEQELEKFILNHVPVLRALTLSLRDQHDCSQSGRWSFAIQSEFKHAIFS